MLFDVFHSLGTFSFEQSERQTFQDFFAQVRLADALGFGTWWTAESHFSSEVQKRHKEPVVPHYVGEVGLNNDSPQLAHGVFECTRRIGFGTAIYNIVGGNGGPIAAADRIRSLVFLNSLRETPRQLHIGVASGRFPYINKPFGIVPRDREEEVLWEHYKRFIFLEALEIFLRLSKGETLSSEDVTQRAFTRECFPSEAAWARFLAEVKQLPPRAGASPERLPYQPRWVFEPLRLVPSLPDNASAFCRFVLGSTDPLARELGLRHVDLDLFSLSVTPPPALEALHAEMYERSLASGRLWHRGRMPRTSLIFIDKDRKRAEDMASRGLDVYLEGMRGTVNVPRKEELLSRVLVGDAAMVREQLSPGNPRGFHPEDCLMLWFEFARDHADVVSQMRYFAEAVMPHLASPLAAPGAGVDSPS
ncbi:LLM class flavin-dependent oxidoreductase [Hyalangium rubrum]|uniref:LLM class flavin-dependent oxidoreductase n=1 Tax=Hyalangium rubrum TaxID=3103134 RepID=A0ABU5HF72_9BACT|nr:LLM class flavin-dependent oxidoreductase [Hyalangium sp. s54d21]MDY7232131.1 LLM class flavin-dependent oxidoreductase [Hyalangium sp. s54d21]